MAQQRKWLEEVEGGSNDMLSNATMDMLLAYHSADEAWQKSKIAVNLGNRTILFQGETVVASIEFHLPSYTMAHGITARVSMPQLPAIDNSSNGDTDNKKEENATENEKKNETEDDSTVNASSLASSSELRQVVDKTNSVSAFWRSLSVSLSLVDQDGSCVADGHHQPLSCRRNQGVVRKNKVSASQTVIIIEVSLYISVQKLALDRSLVLQVDITPPFYPLAVPREMIHSSENVDSLLISSFLLRPDVHAPKHLQGQSRRWTGPVMVTEGVSICHRSLHSPDGTEVIVITVKSLSQQPLQIARAWLHPNNTHLVGEDGVQLGLIPLAEYFEWELAAELPAEMNCGDEHNIVIILRPKGEGLGGSFASDVIVEWKHNGVSESIIQRVGVTWTREERRGILVGITFPRPALLGTSIYVSFSITNLSTESRHLILRFGSFVPLQQTQPSNSRVVTAAPALTAANRTASSANVSVSADTPTANIALSGGVISAGSPAMDSTDYGEPLEEERLHEIDLAGDTNWHPKERNLPHLECKGEKIHSGSIQSYTNVSLSSAPGTPQTHIAPAVVVNAKQYSASSSTEANLISLEQSINLGLLGPRTTATVDVPFVALCEGLLELGNMWVIDSTIPSSPIIYGLVSSCHLYVVSSLSEN